MTSATIHRRIAILAVFTCALLVMAASASADCPSVPENKVWGKVSNQAITRYVQAAYDGDWRQYIAMWEERAEKARDLVSRDSILVFHDQNLWLRGETLAGYAADVEKRVRAVHCLARANADKPVSGETLAGSALNRGS